MSIFFQPEAPKSRATFNFRYDRDPLLSIVASDGRRVSFEHASNTDERIVKVIGNGTPIPQIVEYDYVSSGIDVTYNNLKTIKYRYTSGSRQLHSITYPTGEKITCEYGPATNTLNYNKIYLGGDYNFYPLIKRTRPDGGVYKYSHYERGTKKFSRVIETPVTTAFGSHWTYCSALVPLPHFMLANVFNIFSRY